MHRGYLRITNTKICAGGKRHEGVCEVNWETHIRELSPCVWCVVERVLSVFSALVITKTLQKIAAAHFAFIWYRHETSNITYVVSLSSLAEGLWRPSCMSGWWDQGYCGSESPWQRLRPGQPAWHLHQCAFLHTMDIQSLQILPKPWVGPKKQ